MSSTPRAGVNFDTVDSGERGEMGVLGGGEAM